MTAEATDVNKTSNDVAQEAFEKWLRTRPHHCHGDFAAFHAGFAAARRTPDETSGIQAEIDAANRGLRKYIHEQLGFLTTDDNRPAEALIRLAVKRLRPEETSERRDPNEAHDLITPDIGYTPEKAKAPLCDHDYVWKEDSRYVCDKCGDVSRDGI